jgi:hypothetical protein
MPQDNIAMALAFDQEQQPNAGWTLHVLCGCILMAIGSLFQASAFPAEQSMNSMEYEQ